MNNDISKKIKEYCQKNKKQLRISLDVFLAIIFFIIICGLIYIIELQIEKDTDVSSSVHAIVIEENSKLKSSFWQSFILKPGDNVYILEEETGKDGAEYYKVKWKNRIGKILAKEVAYFVLDRNVEYSLMSDVSKYNKRVHFDSSEDYEFFLIKNDIDFVYIRAGGRGYGQEGNFYTDSDYGMFVNACEYLGVPYGFYFVDEALNTEEVDEEIEYIKEFLDSNSTNMCKLPFTIDIEYHDGKGRTDKIWDTRADIIKELKENLKEIQIESIVYANYKRTNEYLHDLDTKFWLAYYPKENRFPTEWYFTSAETEDTINENLKNKIIGWQFSDNRSKGKWNWRKGRFKCCKNGRIFAIH